VLLLGFGAKFQKVGRDDIGVQIKRRPGGAGGREFFDQHRRVQKVAAHPAVFGGDIAA
jgi:hypothetical protein